MPLNVLNILVHCSRATLSAQLHRHQRTNDQRRAPRALVNRILCAPSTTAFLPQQQQWQPQHWVPKTTNHRYEIRWCHEAWRGREVCHHRARLDTPIRTAAHWIEGKCGDDILDLANTLIFEPILEATSKKLSRWCNSSNASRKSAFVVNWWQCATIAEDLCWISFGTHDKHARQQETTRWRTSHLIWVRCTSDDCGPSVHQTIRIKHNQIVMKKLGRWWKTNRLIKLLLYFKLPFLMKHRGSSIPLLFSICCESNAIYAMKKTLKISPELWSHLSKFLKVASREK